MAIVDIAFTPATLRALETDNKGQDNLADIVDLFFQTSYQYSSAHTYYSNFSSFGTELRLNFKDGASTTFTGVALADPNASSGSATVSAVDETLPGAFRLSYGGLLDYHYQSTGNSLQIANTGGTITSASIQTLLPSYNSAYNTLYGNVTASLHGNIKSDKDGNFTGKLDNFTGRADKLLQSTSVDGVFTVNGNGIAIGQGRGSTTLSGELHAYSEKYVDGSHVLLTNMAVPVTGTTQLDVQLLTNPANFSGNDVISVAMPEQLATALLINAGSGDDRIAIKGGGSKLSASGGSGNDAIVLADDGHNVDGGSGIDTLVLGGARASYSINGNGAAFTVRGPGGVVDTVAQVERIQFSDATIALDVNGNGGQAYRVYQAAFDRAPDLGGLGYWISELDHGASLRNVASAFVQSAEFKSLYGMAPSNHDFLNNLYHNVLHRDGDAGGFAWWLDKLDTHAASFTDLLVSFSESPENQAALAPAISGGILYTPWG